jgi:hypothetical protein
VLKKALDRSLVIIIPLWGFYVVLLFLGMKTSGAKELFIFFFSCTVAIFLGNLAFVKFFSFGGNKFIALVLSWLTFGLVQYLMFWFSAWLVDIVNPGGSPVGGLAILVLILYCSVFFFMTSIQQRFEPKLLQVNISPSVVPKSLVTKDKLIKVLAIIIGISLLVLITSTFFEINT